jgi:hypothetical protein
MIFFTQHDFDLHKETMGLYCSNRAILRRKHEELEFELERERGWADRVIGNFEAAILNYKEQQIKKEVKINAKSQ